MGRAADQDDGAGARGAPPAQTRKQRPLLPSAHPSAPPLPRRKRRARFAPSTAPRRARRRKRTRRPRPSGSTRSTARRARACSSCASWYTGAARRSSRMRRRGATPRRMRKRWPRACASLRRRSSACAALGNDFARHHQGGEGGFCRADGHVPGQDRRAVEAARGHHAQGLGLQPLQLARSAGDRDGEAGAAGAQRLLRARPGLDIDLARLEEVEAELVATHAELAKEKALRVEYEAVAYPPKKYFFESGAYTAAVDVTIIRLIAD